MSRPQTSRRGRAPRPSTSRSPGSRPRAGGGPRPGIIAGCLAALAAAVFVVYAGVLHHDFVRWDDPEYVQENPLVSNRQFGPLLTSVVARNFHPLTLVSLAMNASRPLTARPFLAANVVLHAFNTGLVFALAFFLLRRRVIPAFFTALLFAVHPMHVESVAWVSERKDVLYSCFFLAASVAYLRYLDTRRRWWLGAAFGLFVLSCLSKAVAIVFPGVLILLDFWKRRQILDRRSLLEKAPFVAVSVLFGLIAIDVQGGGDFHGILKPFGERMSALAEVSPFTPYQRVAFPAYGNLMYVVKLFLPTGLRAFYAYPPTVSASYRPEYFLGMAFLLAMAGATVLAFRRSRLAAFGLGWYFVTLLPVMQWIPVGSAIMADRYTYLPYFGLFLILIGGLDALVDRRPSLRAPIWGACALFAAALAVLGIRQVATWKDTEALWSNVIRHDPESGKAYAARGNFRGRSGRVREALADLQRARALNPDRGEVYEDLGNAYGSLGQLDSAIVFFGEALRIDPSLGHTYSNRAVAYLRLGRPREALADLDRAETLMPGATGSLHFPRGNAYLMLGDARRAADEFGRAIDAREGGADAYANRGRARMLLGDPNGATSDLREALRINPAHAEAQALLRQLSSPSP